MKKMLVLYGSGRAGGNTEKLTKYALARIPAGTVQIEEVPLRTLENKFSGCCACDGCQKAGKGLCIQKDATAALINRLPEFDIVVFASPIYWFHLTSQTMAFIDRFYALYHSGDTPLARIRFGYVITSGGGEPDSGVRNAIASVNDIASFIGGKKNAFLYHGPCSDVEEEWKQDPSLAAKADQFLRDLLD